MMVLSPSDTTSDDIQLKIDQLQDLSRMDIQSQQRLWRETLHFRRESIRDRSTADILKDFPGYSNGLLVIDKTRLFCLSDINLVP